MEQIIRWDHTLFFQINNGCQNPFFDFVIGNATWLGDGFVLPILIIPLLYFLDRIHFGRNLLLIISSEALSGGLGLLLKHFVNRPRPLMEFSDLLANHQMYIHVIFSPLRDYSMPSGHTLTVFSAAMALTFLSKRYSLIFFSLAVLTGLSRVYVGAHFPSDVITGAIIGVFSAWLVYISVFRKMLRNNQIFI